MAKTRSVKRTASWQYLVEAYQVCNQKYAQLLMGLNLTPSQLDILIQIEALGENARPKLIASGLLVTKGNITSVTRRLLERSLITQKNDPQDKRSVIFELTEQGKRLLQQAKKAAKSFIDAQLAPFSDKEVQRVGELMQRMRCHLQSSSFEATLAALQTKVAKQESMA